MAKSASRLIPIGNGPGFSFLALLLHNLFVMKHLLISLCLAFGLKAQVLDSFQSGNFLDFSSYPGLEMQVSSASLGGVRFELASGTSPYILGLSKGYLQFGANPGTYGLKVGWGNGLSSLGPKLGLSLHATSTITLQTEFRYFTNSVPATITVSTDATHVSTSPVLDVAADGFHTFSLSLFTGNADFAHINGITLNFVPQVVKNNYGASFEQITITP